jgi:predicted ATPase
MSSVSSISVRGYKSIRELNDLALTNLNVLIGANGAGKSNFIGLFRLLTEMLEQRLQLYVPLQGGADALLHFGRKTTERLSAGFTFSHDDVGHVRLGYEFGLRPTLDNRLIFEFERPQVFGDNPKVLNPVKDLGQGHAEAKLRDAKDSYSRHVLGPVGNWRVYHFHDTGDSAKVKRLHASNDNLRLKPDAANLAAYLRMLRQQHAPEYQRIVDTIKLVLPYFLDFSHRPGEPEFVELEWFHRNDPETPLKAHMLSDGSLRFICLATLLLQPVELLPDTILIDEPELGLHPYAITILVSIFRQVAASRQLIISTQSVELIDELSPQDVIVVEQEEGASTFHRCDPGELAVWLEDYSLGEIWNRNILGGRP